MIYVPCPDKSCSGYLPCPEPAQEAFKGSPMVVTFFPEPPRAKFLRCGECKREVRGSVTFSEPRTIGGQLSVAVNHSLQFAVENATTRKRR